MREAQERRRLVERIEEDILMLREDAKALLKQLDSLNLGDRALHRVDPAEADREIREMGAKCDALVEEVRARTESGELADVRFDSLGPVAEVVANIQASMADWLVRDEKRRKAKDKERAKREEQRAQGLLLSKTDKERKARDDAFRAQLAARGALPKDGAAADGAAADADAAAAQAEGGARKRVVYGNRKKGGGGGGGGGAKPDAGADADAPKPATALERAAARAEGGGGADDDGDDDDGSASDGSASHEDDWEAVDVDALRLGKKPDAEAAAEEDARKRAAALSSKLDGIAASAAKAEAERAKADKLDKLFNFKAPAPKGGKHESDDDDDESGSGSGSDSDSDSESGSESESESDSEEEGEGGLAGQRKEAERLARLDGARAARLARVARSMKARSADDLRSPIVCIMGHVDTGKTKLLDKIRRTNVQAGEAGGITQQIGASFFPADTLRKQTEALQKVAPYEVRVPGLLIIDTPGHESFSNLRSRGSSLCDIAILVIDIMHGLEPQTIESLRMLVEKQTPFVVALNKVDRLYDWKEKPWAPFRESLAAQAEHVRNEFADRAAQVRAHACAQRSLAPRRAAPRRGRPRQPVRSPCARRAPAPRPPRPRARARAQAKLALAEQGVNSELYWDNELYWTDPAYRDYICIVPTSAITGEGIPDLLQLLVNMNQRQQYMLQRIMWSSEPQATVLEVKVVEGLGHTVDIILANGSLKQGDTIVLCGFNGPIVTTVRALLTPQPLKEIRIKADYIHHTEIRGAQGIKIAANNLDKVVAGGSLLVLHNPKDEDELEVLKEEVMVDLAKLAKAVSDLSDGDGVYAMASTLGSLEALLEFLRTSKIPVHAINIGPVHKLDVIRASTQLDRHNPEYATILAFDVPVTKDAEKHADDVGVKIFTANIIYHLFDHFTKYMAEVRAQPGHARRRQPTPRAAERDRATRSFPPTRPAPVLRPRPVQVKVKNQEAARLIAAFPVITAIIPEFIFNRGGPGDPFVAGMTVKEGILRRGTPLCVVNPAPAGSTDGARASRTRAREAGPRLCRAVALTPTGRGACAPLASRALSQAPSSSSSGASRRSKRTRRRWTNCARGRAAPSRSRRPTT
jgi:translation initiation factor 5B